MTNPTNTLVLSGLSLASFSMGVVLWQTDQENRSLQKEKSALVSRLEQSMQVDEAARQKLQNQIRNLQNELWATKVALSQFRVDDNSLERLPFNRGPVHSQEGR